ncbi:MAG: PorT family protein [Bacteroidales bacterium]|nr:PorT family protein [Bacteroidales bacterium]
MMKKLFLILLAGLVSLTAFPQVKFGIKAGASTSTVPEYNFTTGENNIEALKDAAFGFHAGAFVRVTLFGIYLMPEVCFASTTYDYNVSTAEEPEKILSQKFDKLEVPVLLGVTLGPVRINAGPSASILIGSPRELINDPDFKELYRSATFGYQAGIGTDLFKHLTIDLRYGGSLSKRFGESVTIGSQTFNLDHREPSFLLSIGYMF